LHTKRRLKAIQARLLSEGTLMQISANYCQGLLGTVISARPLNYSNWAKEHTDRPRLDPQVERSLQKIVTRAKTAQIGTNLHWSLLLDFLKRRGLQFTFWPEVASRILLRKL
jgi:hypothetical protein